MARACVRGQSTVVTTQLEKNNSKCIPHSPRLQVLCPRLCVKPLMLNKLNFLNNFYIDIRFLNAKGEIFFCPMLNRILYSEPPWVNSIWDERPLESS